MDWQETSALLIVAGTLVAFVWARCRPRNFSFQRDTHCGCSAPSLAGVQPSIVFHARKGETPRVLVKMK